MHQEAPAWGSLRPREHLVMHLGRPWNAGLQNCSVEGLEGFHQGV